MSHITTWLDERRELGALFIRLFMSTFLIYMAQDNVFDRTRMVEFERFLGQFGFPMPLLSAHVSVYAQFVCGILILLGAFARVAAAAMVVNFVVALAMVHTRLPFRGGARSERDARWLAVPALPRCRRAIDRRMA
jgi:putative oxidoreductase